MSNQPKISVQNLTKVFDGMTVLDDISFEINKDEAYDYTVKLGEEELLPGEDGKYTIPGTAITGDVVIKSALSDENYATLTYMFDGKVVYVGKALKDGDYPEVKLPTKAGYDVTGWYGNIECTGEPVSGKIGNGATTLYAKATIKSIAYSFVNGETAVSSGNKDYGEGIPFPTENLENLKKDGFKFVGWKGSNGVVIPKADSYSYTMPDVAPDEEGNLKLTFSPIWQEIGSLMITVKDTNGVVSGATVNLMKNGAVVKTAVTGSDGKARFSDLDYGAYNVVVVSSIDETNTVNTTAGKDVTSHTNELTVNVPTCKLNTVVNAVGIGLNLNQQSWPEGIPNPVSMKMLTGKDYEPHSALEALHEKLCLRFEQLATKEGRVDLEAEFRQYMFRLEA